MGEIRREVLVDYFNSLVNRVWKCIPILEGRDASGRVVYLPDIAKENFQKYLGKILIEIYGNSEYFFIKDRSFQVIGILKGCLMEVPVDDFNKVRSCIFDTTNLLSRMIEDLKKGGDVISV